jgi:hypothetical protein
MTIPAEGKQIPCRGEQIPQGKKTNSLMGYAQYFPKEEQILA